MHTDIVDKNNFKKPGASQNAPDLKITEISERLRLYVHSLNLSGISVIFKPGAFWLAHLVSRNHLY